MKNLNAVDFNKCEVGTIITINKKAKADHVLMDGFVRNQSYKVLAKTGLLFAISERDDHNKFGRWVTTDGLYEEVLYWVNRPSHYEDVVSVTFSMEG